MNEFNIINKVHDQLVALGYSPYEIKHEVRLSNGNILDMVIYQDEKPWIVVEIKTSKFFPKFSDKYQVKFNAYVRQLQSYAHAINAPFYLLSNGEEYLWFRTDENGRPSIIDHPKKVSTEKLPSNLSEDLIEDLLKQFNYITIEFSYKDRLLLILAKILTEKGNNSLLKQIINSLHELTPSRLKYENFPELELPRGENVIKAFDILKLIPFTEVNPHYIIKALDKINENDKNRFYRVQRWLADFMVQISNVEKNSNILDICNINRNISNETLNLLHDNSNNLFEIKLNVESALHSKIQQIIFGYRSEILFANEISSSKLDLIERPNNIIITPNFSKSLKVNIDPLASKTENTFNGTVNTCLKFAMDNIKDHGRIVILVPDSFLFSKSEKNIRKSLFNKLKLTAIISLGTNFSYMYSKVKTSLLVLDNVSTQESNNVFMTHINEIPYKDHFNSFDIEVISQTLHEFKKWEQNDRPFVQNSMYWTTPSHKLDINNLSAIRYINLLEHDTIQSDFNANILISLEEIAEEILRGQTIKLDDNGEVSVIGPACVRPMELLSSGIGKSRMDNISRPHLFMQEKDILFNNISTYLGSATLVDSRFKNSYFSKHVILIRPNKSVVLPEFLEVALNSQYVYNQIHSLSVGAVIPSINLQNLKEILIPLPSIEMQQVFVEKMNGLRNKINVAQKQLFEVEEEYKKLINSITVGGKL